MRTSSHKRVVNGLVFAVVAGSLGFAPPARATMDFQKKAKAAGIAAVTNCQSCHVAKMPSKETHELNEMGQWLLKEKDTRKAKDIDVTWLKESTPPKK